KIKPFAYSSCVSVEREDNTVQLTASFPLEREDKTVWETFSFPSERSVHKIRKPKPIRTDGLSFNPC
ncbi:MAG TPA: hypothetical protein PKH29_09640, partial [Oscillospiraceae bacterium]|nr:hypothetical protein [Oscillospiraceae bacterium]